MQKNYVQEILNIIHGNIPQAELAEKLSDYHEKDLADALEALMPAERKSLYPILGVDEVAEIFAYLDDAEPYLKELSRDEAAKVISNMDSDDAADALEDLDEIDKGEIVNKLDRDSIEDVKMLLSYSEDEIGSKMTTNYIRIKNDMTIRQAMSELVKQAGENDNISVLYVVDENEHFYGAIDLKDLIIARAEDPLAELIVGSYPYVTDREKISDCIFLIVCPVGMIFAKAVMQNGRLDFSPAVQTLLNPENAHMIGNSLLLGVLVVLLSTLIAAPLAYLFSRTKFARYRVFDILFMIPFMTPPYIASMGWILFMQKKGLLQQLIPAAAGCEKIFFTLGGLVLVMSLHVFPFMLTMLKNAMLNIPSSLEEAGAVFGAGFSARMRKIFLPLLSGNYAIGALLVFVKTLSEYGTPSTLGKRIGFEVFTTEIHRHATVAPIDFGSSATLSSVLVGICLCMWMLQNYITTRKSYNLVSGKGARRVEQSMGKGATVAAWAYIVLVLLIAVGVPYFSVISTSLINLRGYGLAPGNFTIAHYVELFTENEKGLSALKNSVFLAVTSATICAVLGTLLVLAVRKSHSKLRKVVEAIGLLPEMLPGIVLVIGIMLFWNQIYNILPLYNTMGIMVLAYVVLFLPYTVQYVTSSFTQISDSLMAAGQVFGGSPVYILRRITLPLIRQGIATGWMMTFIIAFRELVTASLIAPPNTLVVSTFIVREFEQGSVSVGMAMAVLCVLFSTTALLILNTVIDHRKVH